ncbi:hypothetical protein E6C27_scaffold908G00990 [Cucumis melo var. makuwa]|uniref:Uncharacterized protein n=1 Tax=Cucumis melo var. makuwa TaxID=1194695 RepID=A0A5A7U1D8_CUCMM|nr:hypothetical protein E6C27_scaffold908G00990 [Cucumis melo var. makuwa]
MCDFPKEKIREHPFARSYGVILSSSFNIVLSSALVYSTCSSVSVWGTTHDYGGTLSWDPYSKASTRMRKACRLGDRTRPSQKDFDDSRSHPFGESLEPQDIFGAMELDQGAIMLSLKDGCFQAHLLVVIARELPFPLSGCLRTLAYDLGCFPLDFGS